MEDNQIYKKEFIDRIPIIQRLSIDAHLKSFMELMQDDAIIEELKKAPVADVAPIIHAKWIKNTEMRRADGHIYDYCCSACGAFAQKGCYNNYDKLTPYCAECGAKMDGE